MWDLGEVRLSILDTTPNYSTVLVLRNLYNKYPAKCVDIAKPLK